MNESNIKYSSSSIIKGSFESSNITAKKTHANSSTTEPVSNNLIHFPKKQLGNESDNFVNNRIQIQKASNTVVSEFENYYEDLNGYLKKAIDITERINLNATYKPYVGTSLKEDIKLKEAEERVLKIQAKFSAYRYYSLIWTLSAFLCGVFVVLGITGALATFSSTTGILATIVGSIGAFIDWKDREKKYEC
ncbi:hypothetical protein CSV80_15655 [Sporosarcina sp. P12(2017)]|uniref:hypothetical protein n=1 Tax=unclassified Sporosarcina TaxID=2647733 RepID=UPI000C16C24A|nr:MULTISPECIES: hypothetical protein [unclassified Sporosarcina]PIC56264.1 hypothetical protein CSV81_15235 [Sporosarcina sp. P10]PIC59508.1 hypothetical protein CSV80_15655 [Sporosarcina sp. P12(2017)]